jgi:hypothetical protein
MRALKVFQNALYIFLKQINKRIYPKYEKNQVILLPNHLSLTKMSKRGLTR